MLGRGVGGLQTSVSDVCRDGVGDGGEGFKHGWEGEGNIKMGGQGAIKCGLGVGDH